MMDDSLLAIDKSATLQYLRILIVEDQANTRAMLRDMVRSLGVETIFLAKDGTEAVAILRNEKEAINLIICDWIMPEMSGLDLLAAVRQVDPHIPFLMVTGKADRDAVKTAKAHGVSGYIAKPVSRAQIEIKLRVLGRRLILNPSQQAVRA